MKSFSLVLGLGLCLLASCQIDDKQKEMSALRSNFEANPSIDNLAKLMQFSLFEADDPKSGIGFYEAYKGEANELTASLYASSLCKQAGKESALDKKLQFVQKGLYQFEKNRALFPHSSLVLVYQVSTLGHFPKELEAGERTLAVAQELLQLKTKNAEGLTQAELDALGKSFSDLTKTYPDLESQANAILKQLKELNR